MINKSKVTTADVMAGNGVVHVVDKVIALPTVVDVALQNPDFSILVSALTRDDISGAMLVPTLNGNGRFTVFAPTDAAFVAALGELELSALSDIPAARLEQILKYHVVANANVLAATLESGQEVTTFETGMFTITIANGKTTITDEASRVAEITLTDVQASNGVIHVINKVILPEAPM